MQMRNYIKAVVFDWSGTLVDFGCMAPVAVFVKVFREYGVKLDLKTARRPMGLAKIDHLRTLLTYPEVTTQWLSVHGDFPAETMIMDMFRLAEELMSETVIRNAIPIAGAAGLMDFLRQKKIKTGSTTGYSENIMRALLHESSIQEVLPDCVVTASDIPQGRPKPWMCFLNAQLLDVYPLHQMIKIGDTEADMAEGTNAGMWTIGLTLSGNEAGMTPQEYENQSPELLEQMHTRLTMKLSKAGAHYTARGLWDCGRALEDINRRISMGERPTETPYIKKNFHNEYR
jgi:phosphonoacetaldehyde hydrolase